MFLCLTHTLGWPADKWRILDTAHKKRNLVEYEGEADVEESAIVELIALTAELIADATKLVKPPRK